jgi:RNA polymerase sigma-70 factor (ECF subfamily)
MDDRDRRWQAVEQAYRDHADDVYRVALAILREPDAAVDVTHDTFARAFDRWEQYDNARPLRAWLHGIASHAALDALRHRRVRALALPLLGHIHDVADVRNLGGDPADRLADRDQIEIALAELKPDARAALVLRHYYGYDYVEIGRFLRTSPGNVGSILSRSHALLRARLAAAGVSAAAGDRTPDDPQTDLPAPRRAAR